MPFVQAGRRGLFFRPQAEWSPLALGSALAGWWDAGDAATVHHTAGVLSSLDEKSGNAGPLVATGTSKPTYSATGFQSNVPGITFDGVNDFMEASGVALGADKASFFLFGQFDLAPVLNHRLLAFEATGHADYDSALSAIPFQVNGSLLLSSYRNFTTLSQSGALGNSAFFVTPSVYYRMAAIFDGAVNSLYVDNLLQSTPVASTGNFGASGILRIGAGSGGASPWTGVVKEMIVMNRDATANERAAIDSYLVRPWTRVLVAVGDSLVRGDPVNGIGYPLQSIPNTSPALFLDNFAMPGSTFGDVDVTLDTSYENRKATIYARIPANKRGRKYILYVNYTNNFATYNAGASHSASGYAAALASAAAEAKANRFDYVITGTVLSRTDAQSNDTLRNSFNAIIAAPGWAAANNFDGIADFASDPTMGVDAAPTLHADKFIDGVHYNLAGGVLLEPYFRNVVNALP